MVDGVFMQRARHFRSAALRRSHVNSVRNSQQIAPTESIPPTGTHVSSACLHEAIRRFRASHQRSQAWISYTTKISSQAQGPCLNTLDIQVSRLDVSRAPTVPDPLGITTVSPTWTSRCPGWTCRELPPTLHKFGSLTKPRQTTPEHHDAVRSSSARNSGQKPTARPSRMSPPTPVLRWIAVPSLSTIAIPAIASSSANTANAPPRCLV